MKKQETKQPEKVEQKKLFKSESCITISPKTLPFEVYHLVDLNPKRIEDLINYLGKAPKVKFEAGKMLLFFSNKLPYLFDNCVIYCDNLKNIIWIKSFDEVQKNYNVLKS